MTKTALRARRNRLVALLKGIRERWIDEVLAHSQAYISGKCTLQEFFEEHIPEADQREAWMSALAWQDYREGR